MTVIICPVLQDALAALCREN